ncbi:MAG: cupredoxin domain-containing protein [Proteobacteria bacterium]|nr:cupredoxin domain-containing protein [Pseudomonadota bacterium]
MTFCRLLLTTALLLPISAHADDYVLTLKDHKFTPDTLEVASGTKHTLTVKNEDSSPAEFESNSLSREKIIKGNSEAKISVGPLKPGNYEFMDEFHDSTAKGTLIVK